MNQKINHKKIAIEHFLYAILVVFSLVGFYFPIVQRYNENKNPILETCRFVKDRIVQTEGLSKNWFSDCRELSQEDNRYPLGNKSKFKKLDQFFLGLGVSHLSLFDENESLNVWNGQSVSNGVESDYVDGLHLVTNIFSNSSAQKHGLNVGDEILSEQITPSNIDKFNGIVMIKRKNNSIPIKLVPEVFIKDRAIKIYQIKGYHILKVPSFNSKYFEWDDLKEKIKSLRKKDSIIIDFRNNEGGNFVAGLRFLSLFFCKPILVGSLRRGVSSAKSEDEFDDNLNDQNQIEKLKNANIITLKTFKLDFCLPTPKAVIIDARTKSTAEWVSLSFRELSDVPLMGATTAGELLVSIWYSVTKIWGFESEISIPEAIYESIKEERIEGRGVSPTITIFKKHQDYQKQKDSVLLQVIDKLSVSK